MKIVYFESDHGNHKSRQEIVAETNSWLDKQGPGVVESVTPLSLRISPTDEKLAFVIVCHGKSNEEA